MQNNLEACQSAFLAIANILHGDHVARYQAIILAEQTAQTFLKYVSKSSSACGLQLKENKNYHSEKQHACEICSLRFKSTHNVTNHISRVHTKKSKKDLCGQLEDGRRICRECSEEFENDTKFLEHYKIEHFTRRISKKKTIKKAERIDV